MKFIKQFMDWVLFRSEVTHVWTQKMVGRLKNGEMVTLISYRTRMRDTQNDIARGIFILTDRRVGVIHQVTRVMHIPRWSRAKNTSPSSGVWTLPGDLMRDENV